MTASQERKGREPLQFQGTFEVREFKLEKIKLTMDFPRRVWFRGEKIEATLQAAYYWGEPLANRWSSAAPCRTAASNVSPPMPKARPRFVRHHRHAPAARLVFTASLDGDNVTAQRILTLARLGFSHRRQAQPAGGHRRRAV
jgi:alpha-2-macroglobulin